MKAACVNMIITGGSCNLAASVNWITLAVNLYRPPMKNAFVVAVRLREPPMNFC